MIVFSVIIIACNTDIQSENQQAPDQANSKNIVIETKENATSVPSDSTMIDKTPSQHTNEENIIFYATQLKKMYDSDTKMTFRKWINTMMNLLDLID